MYNLGMLMHVQMFVFLAESLNDDNIPWLPFVTAAASSIAATSSVESAVEVACEALADHPEGPQSRLSKALFIKVVTLIAEAKGVEHSKLQPTLDYLEGAAEQRGGVTATLAAQSLWADRCPRLD